MDRDCGFSMSGVVSLESATRDFVIFMLPM